MNLRLSRLLILFFVCCTFLGCRSHATKKWIDYFPQHFPPAAGSKVFVKKQKNRFYLEVNGAPFVVRGAAGYSHFSEMAAAGCNTARTWDSKNLTSILDSAAKYQIMVLVGIDLPFSYYIHYYQDPQWCDSTLYAIQQTIQSFSPHPAVLGWVLGNELVFPYRPSFNPFYSFLQRALRKIHQLDPYHPITTTMINFDRKSIDNITRRLPEFDFLSFNIFGRLPQLRSDRSDFSWRWNGPFLLTEWWPEGGWESPKTTWGAAIENASWKKASRLYQFYTQYMPTDDAGFLGDMVFYWGHRWEETGTWFNIFSPFFSEKTDLFYTVKALRKEQATLPDTSSGLRYILLNQQGAADHILLSPKDSIQANAVFTGSTSEVKKILWSIYPDTWYAPPGGQLVAPLPEKTTFLNRISPSEIPPFQEISWKTNAPTTPGPYRLYLHLVDKNDILHSANIPFWILE